MPTPKRYIHHVRAVGRTDQGHNRPDHRLPSTLPLRTKSITQALGASWLTAKEFWILSSLTFPSSHRPTHHIINHGGVASRVRLSATSRLTLSRSNLGRSITTVCHLEARSQRASFDLWRPRSWAFARNLPSRHIISSSIKVRERTIVVVVSCYSKRCLTESIGQCANGSTSNLRCLSARPKDLHRKCRRDCVPSFSQEQAA